MAGESWRGFIAMIFRILVARKILFPPYLSMPIRMVVVPSLEVMYTGGELFQRSSASTSMGTTAAARFLRLVRPRADGWVSFHGFASTEIYPLPLPVARV